VGEQTGQTKKCSKLAPSLANESIFGVERSVFPFRLRSPHPWSSVKKTMTLGLVAAKQENALKTNIIGRCLTIFMRFIDIDLGFWAHKKCNY
jgi:hypothetical protein